MPASWTSQPRSRSRSAIASATFRLCCVYVKYTNRTRGAFSTTRLRPTRGGACRGALGGGDQGPDDPQDRDEESDRKSTRLNSSHANISYAVFCLKKKKKKKKKRNEDE